MVRNLTTWVLSGALGFIVMAGDAQACHKKKCMCTKPMPVPCTTVTYVQPPAPVATTSCAPKVKHCGFKMPKLFHHKAVATCVSYAAAVTSGYPASSPQSTPQH